MKFFARNRTVMVSVVAPALFVAGLFAAIAAFERSAEVFSETEPEFEGSYDGNTHDLYAQFRNWKRPEGPLRVGLQVGHWKNSELPDELSNLRETGGGAHAAGVAEWEASLAVAEAAAVLLREAGVEVDILPATIPPSYWADAFVSIHADGNTDTRVTGFKAASPRRDLTGRSGELVSLLYEEYGKATGLREDPNITRNMRGYYAFNWLRYEHAVHPMAPKAILETGFLTNAGDRRMLMQNTDVPARGIANAVLRFLGITDSSPAGDWGIMRERSVITG